MMIYLPKLRSEEKDLLTLPNLFFINLAKNNQSEKKVEIWEPGSFIKKISGIFYRLIFDQINQFN